MIISGEKRLDITEEECIIDLTSRTDALIVKEAILRCDLEKKVFEKIKVQGNKVIFCLKKKDK